MKAFLDKPIRRCLLARYYIQAGFTVAKNVPRE